MPLSVSTVCLEAPRRALHRLRRGTEVGDGDHGRTGVAGVADEPELRLVDDERPAGDGRVTVAVLPALRGLHRCQRVEQPGSLLRGRVPEVGGGAGDQLLDQSGSRAHAAVGVLVGLDDQRGSAGGERGRLAGATEVLDRVTVGPRRSCTLRRGSCSVCTAPSPGHRERRGPGRHRPGWFRRSSGWRCCSTARCRWTGLPRRCCPPACRTGTSWWRRRRSLHPCCSRGSRWCRWYRRPRCWQRR